ncbi:MAG: abortive infection system antitoxin AbiGi family protein [FCB group bacterium]|jgi:hypothetical protein
MLTQSNIIIHWTDKTFHPIASDGKYDVSFETINEDICNLYLERLKSIKNNGLYMMKYHETVIGYDRQGFQSDKNATCFTDLGILNSFNHVKKYGLMGIGVTRKFILERDGRPVWYLLNSPEDLIAPTFDMFFNLYKKYHQTIQELDEIYIYMSNAVFYFKGMGAEGTMDFDNLQEREWRIIYSKRVFDQHKIINTGRTEPEFTIPINIDDIELLIMPNRTIREKLFQDSELRDWICSARTIPIILSLEEYYSF